MFISSWCKQVKFHVQRLVKEGAVRTDADFNNFVAGFVTGEGSFFVTLQKQAHSLMGRQVVCGFSIKLRADDLELLRTIWRALGYAGNIHHVSANRYRYARDSITRHDSVMLIARKLDELTTLVIPFFDNHPLRGQKRLNYELWKEVVHMMERGEHLTSEGFEKILALKAEINQYRGQDEKAEVEYPGSETDSPPTGQVLD